MLIKEQLKDFETLSYAEKSVAEKLLELGGDIKDISVRELASLAYTATSAVTRLCVKLGYKGYNDFKDAYLAELIYINTHFQHIDANTPFHKEDSLSRVCSSIAHLYEETSKDTLSLIDYTQLIHATSLLNKAKHIYVLCFGSGIDIAKVFADRMMRIGKKVTISDNQNQQYYQSYNADKEDCFIVISYTGTTSKTRIDFENVIKSDASCIVITSVGENYLSERADATLHMTTREKIRSNIGSFSSSASTMMVLDILYSSLFHKNYDENFARKKQLALDYEHCRLSINEVMSED